MKKFLCLMLSMLLLTAFCACADDTANESPDALTSSEASETSEVSAEESITPASALTVNGNAIENYTIVYAVTNETAKYSIAANALKDYFKTTYDVELEVVNENSKETENEIIIGLTNNRDADDAYEDDFDYGEYAVEIKGGKIVIAGSYATGCYQGIEALIEKINASEGALTEQTFEGEGKVYKLSCVGDSITHGINSSNPNKYTYPCYIQEMLGLDYYVYNAGVSGLSICKNDELAYKTRPAYTTTLELAPDIVIFALGTNDANPKIDKYPYKNWEDPDHDRSAEFVESTKELLDSFRQANENVQIFVVYPASLFVVGADSWQAEAWTDTIVKYVRPLLEQVVAEYELPTVDLFDWSKEHPEVFVDGLHPYDESYQVLAQYIYDNIKDTIIKP